MDLEAINNPSEKPGEEDVIRAKQEEQKLINEKLALQNSRYEQDTNQRNWLSGWAAVLVSFWLIMVLLILAGNNTLYKLTDSVLITLLGTTTLNVLGLMVIVLNDLFSKEKPN